MPAEQTTVSETRPGGPESMMAFPHPLDQLSVAESDIARQVILEAHGGSIGLIFRSIALEEPPKDELIKFLELENAGRLTFETPRPTRVAKVSYDIVRDDRSHEYTESFVDVQSATEVSRRIVDEVHQAALTTNEFREFTEACLASRLYQKAIAEFEIPDGFRVQIDPWPYGSDSVVTPRYTQGLCFAQDIRSGNEDSNHYGYPLPLIPVLDTYRKEIVRVDRLATGGKEDGLSHGTHSRNVLDLCAPAEYLPELLSRPLRASIKPLSIIQPEGASFQVNNNLVKWQKWISHWLQSS